MKDLQVSSRDYWLHTYSLETGKTRSAPLKENEWRADDQTIPGTWNKESCSQQEESGLGAPCCLELRAFKDLQPHCKLGPLFVWPKHVWNNARLSIEDHRSMFARRFSLCQVFGARHVDFFWLNLARTTHQTTNRSACHAERGASQAQRKAWLPNGTPDLPLGKRIAHSKRGNFRKSALAPRVGTELCQRLAVVPPFRPSCDFQV